MIDTGDICRRFVSVVMDASRKGERRYWTGCRWVYDPAESSQSLRANDGMASEYLDLVSYGCQVGLVTLEYSRTDMRVTVHGIIAWEITTHDRGRQLSVLNYYNQV